MKRIVLMLPLLLLTSCMHLTRTVIVPPSSTKTTIVTADAKSYCFPLPFVSVCRMFLEVNSRQVDPALLNTDLPAGPALSPVSLKR